MSTAEPLWRGVRDAGLLLALRDSAPSPHDCVTFGMSISQRSAGGAEQVGDLHGKRVIVRNRLMQVWGRLGETGIRRALLGTV